MRRSPTRSRGARSRLARPILKYGAPIGVATQAIAAGAHVHVHNMRSDYTPTYHLEDERQPGAGS